MLRLIVDLVEATIYADNPEWSVDEQAWFLSYVFCCVFEMKGQTQLSDCHPPIYVSLIAPIALSQHRFMQEGICRFCRVVVEFLRMYADLRNSSPILGSIGIMIEESWQFLFKSCEVWSR
ncbi:hypothetical protein P8452_54791 [Trifolium repens]|nr:hypothetical protein P8452_54791 [Trifolium repens]